MKFKKYMKESIEPTAKHTLVIEEDLNNPDRSSYAEDELYRLYAPIEKMIEDGKFEEASKELDELSAELSDLEARNATKRIFKFPQRIIDAQRKQIDLYRSKLPKTESIEDMDKRCENCNTLLTDAGECPKCDHGEEDYGNEITEELSVREKLKKAYPELNFDTPVVEEVAVETCEECDETSVEESITEEVIEEELTNAQKLKRAYPELNIDVDSAESVTEEIDEYDDEYDIEDDVELDRRHAALYGGERMYCNCGHKLSYDEYGSYCPNCTPRDPEASYDDSDVVEQDYTEFDDEF